MIQKGLKKLDIIFDPDKGITVKGPRALLPSFAEIARMIYPVTASITIRESERARARSILFHFELTSAAPHATTTRWTYTVPDGKNAILETAYVMVIRRSAAPTSSYANFRLWDTAEINAQFGILAAASIVDMNGVGDKDRDHITGNIILHEGDILSAISYDISDGGTVGYWSGAKIEEFDV